MARLLWSFLIIFALAVTGFAQEVKVVTGQEPLTAVTIIRWIVILGLLGTTTYQAFMNRTTKAKQDVIDTQKDNLKALDDKCKRLVEESIEKDKRIITLEGDIKVLQVRTDISPVFQLLQSFKSEDEIRSTKLDNYIKEMQSKIQVLEQRLGAAHEITRHPETGLGEA